MLSEFEAGDHKMESEIQESLHIEDPSEKPIYLKKFRLYETHSVNLQIYGKCFNLTLIARRSWHYAGTRFLKRGVNEEGHVANDVETEQIVIKDIPDGSAQISSVVQNRGSIPLFWSQETSRLNIKPDIILSKKDPEYEATRLHFKDLAKRYGNPIIILNLIKNREERPRESILCAEFHNAIELINKHLPEENHLKFLHWDLCNFSRRNCEGNDCNMQKNECCYLKDVVCRGADDVGDSTSFQKGVLRTNCIDCLDRTNVAQFAYGLVAFGRQLHILRLQNTPDIDLDSPLADELLRLYEMMGDTLALQYGGSAAHDKIFCQRRGQWKAATRSQEIFRTLQRYYNNAYMDAKKQDAINVFLGHFQLHQGKQELWKMDSDQHHNVGNRRSNFSEENANSGIKRSLSDGIFLSESNSPTEHANIDKHDEIKPAFPDMMQDSNNVHSESAPDIFTCKSQASYHRFTPGLHGRQLFPNIHPEEELFSYSNFLDLDWHSTSGNSLEEELCWSII